MVADAALLGLLLAGHAVGDRPLQPKWLARRKNRNKPTGERWWTVALPVHAGIHGTMVGLVTGSVALAIAECIAHGTTDFLKCERRLTTLQDQMVHAACKLLWWMVCLTFLQPAGLWRLLGRSIPWNDIIR